MNRNIVFLASTLLTASIHAEEQSLREAVGGRFDIGCAVSGADIDDPKLAAIVTKHFNAITPEFELMPEFMVGDDRKFTFGRGDKLVEFAEKNDMAVYGHMLIWHFVTRKWLFESADGKPLPREQALENLKFYIDGVCGHYKGRIKAWDVVNEAISDTAGEYLKDTPALRAIGEDYVLRAYEFAHAADPEAKLYYNDYNIEQPDKLEKTVRLVKSIQAAGVPVDAVGIQGHWLIEWPPVEMISKGIDGIAATGVKVMVTELDVDVLPRDVSGADMKTVEKGANPFPEGLSEEMQEKLAKRYAEIVGAIAAQPEVVMVGFWGTHDGRSWLNDYPVKDRTNHPLLFDRKLEPKPALGAVIKALEK